MIACDISGLDNKGKFIVFGTLWLPLKYLPDYEKEVCNFRIEEKEWGELKWVKNFNETHLEKYKKFITLTIKKFPVEFAGLVIYKNKIDASYHKNPEEMYSKFFWLTITNQFNRLNNIEKSGIKNGLYLLLDDEDWARQENLTLKSFLDKFLKNKSLDVGVKHLSGCDSKICSLMQGCDIITGAINRKLNSISEKKDIKSSKAELIKHIENILGNKLLGTDPWRRKFNLWLFKIDEWATTKK